MPNLKESTESVADAAKNAAYVAIGLGVIGFQRAQVRRQELSKEFSERFGGSGDNIQATIDAAKAELAKQVEKADTRVEQLLDRIEAGLGPIEARLPEQARTAVTKAQAQARQVGKQVREKIIATLAA